MFLLNKMCVFEFGYVTVCLSVFVFLCFSRYVCLYILCVLCMRDRVYLYVLAYVSICKNVCVCMRMF